MKYEQVEFFSASHALINDRYQRGIRSLLGVHKKALKAGDEANLKLAASIDNLLLAVRECCQWQKDV